MLDSRAPGTPRAPRDRPRQEPPDAATTRARAGPARARSARARRAGRGAASAGGGAQLLLEVRAVRLDRADRQVELARDLCVRVAEGDQAEHLDLALGQ